MSFQNKVVWITGASSGIGEAFAYTFAKQKAKLILSARRVDELERVKKACNLPDSDVFILPLDVSDFAAVESAAKKALAQFGQIDVLINNAGLSHWSKIKDTPFDVIKKIMDTNFMGGVALSKAVLPNMIERKQGTIVVISSILGKMYMQKQGAYIASKHALQGFYDGLRTEVAKDGVNILLVSPGFVRTNVAKNSLDRNGQPINKDNPAIMHGLDPMDVAADVLSAIEGRKTDIVLAKPREKFAVYLRRFAPGMFRRMMGNSKML